MKKRGMEKLISIYWFVILVLIAGGITLMVNAFYKTPYDVREIEADILTQKVGDCIYFGGKMNLALIKEGIFREEFKDNFAERCSLNFEMPFDWQEPQYYVKVNIFRKDAKSHLFDLSLGNVNWVSDCELSESYESFVKCNGNSFYAVDERGEIYYVDILSVVRKAEENV